MQLGSSTMPSRRCCSNSNSRPDHHSFFAPLQTWSRNHNRFLLAILNINNIISIISSKYYGNNNNGKGITFIKINLQRQSCNLPHKMHITRLLEFLQTHPTGTRTQLPQPKYATTASTIKYEFTTSNREEKCFDSTASPTRYWHKCPTCQLEN